MGQPATSIPFEHFGGLITLVDRTDLGSPGPSPDCRNVVFYPGRVQKRPGLTSLFSVLGGTPKINGISLGVGRHSQFRTFIFDSQGALWEESTEGTLTLMAGWKSFGAENQMKSVSAYGREYFCFSNEGWGAAPNVFLDDSIAGRSVMGAGLYYYRLGISRPPFAPRVVEPYGGVVSAGVHKVILIGVGIDGARSYPSLQTTITATGGKQFKVTAEEYRVGWYDILWPQWVENVQIAMTQANGATFYVVGETGKNSLVGVVGYGINISDTTLGAGEIVSDAWNILVPDDSGAVFGPFDGRIALVGGIMALDAGNDDSGLLNLDFQYAETGGWLPGWYGVPGVGGLAALWSQVPDSSYYPPGYTGQVLALSIIPGYNSVALNNGDVRYNLPVSGNPFNLRIRFAKTPHLSAGDIRCRISDNVTYVATFTIPYASLDISWKIIEVSPTGYDYFKASYPLPLTMTFDIPGWAQSGSYGFGLVDYVQIVERGAAQEPDWIVWSRPGFPNEFDNITSYENVEPGDGQRVTNVFVLAGRKYAVKERSLHLIIDGTGDPDAWLTQKIADGVGTPSFKGVGVGNEFVVICGRDGVYVYQGGGITSENLITKEIQPTWDSINWQYGHKIWCLVDESVRRVYVGVPLGAVTEPTTMLVLDYTEGWNDPLVSGGLIVTRGRKWTIWDTGANSAALVERADGTRQLWLGNNTATGKIYKLDETVYADDGVAIDSYYEATPVGIGPDINLLERLLLDLHGIGSVNVSVLDYLGTETVLGYAPTLSDPSHGLTKILAHKLSERVSVKIRNVSNDGYWTLCKMFQLMKPWRGVSGRPLNP